MSTSHPTVAAVLVTHNSSRMIRQTLESIMVQRHPADAIIVIDDNSTDSTRSMIHDLLGDRAQVYRATSRVDDVNTRIAQNFQQGLRAAASFDVAVLGDHDDIWHHERIGHQANQLRLHPDVHLLASNGRLVDASGNPTGGTLRDTFPVPADFNALEPAEQMRYVIRHSIATGGASAVRPNAFADVPIAPGWLHDRWWSMVATATQAVRIDHAVVIDYRLSEAQQVGLDRGHQGESSVQRLKAAATGAPHVLGKLADFRQLQAMAEDSGIRRTLGPISVLRALR